MPPTVKHDLLDDRTMAVIRETAREVVQEHVRSCPLVGEFRTMQSDFYGPPGEKGEHPGVLGDVADLKRSRSLMRLGLRGAWVMLVAIAGALATKIFGSTP